MSQIRTVIVDDESLARDNLRLLLQQYDFIDLIRECRNGFEAIEAIQQLKPDLVFLDVRMPVLDGFDTLRQLGSPVQPVVVFVTAYSEFALKAFDENALDYVLKPVNDQRFDETIRRVVRRIRERDIAEYTTGLLALLEPEAPKAISPSDEYPRSLKISSIGKTQWVPVDTIDYISSAGNYVRLTTSGGKFLMRKSMKALETLLDPEYFIRVHRSTIVNVNSIRQVRPTRKGDYVMVLADDTQLRMSRRYRHRLDSWDGFMA